MTPLLYELTPLGKSLHREVLNPLTKWAMANMPGVVQARTTFTVPGAEEG